MYMTADPDEPSAEIEQSSEVIDLLVKNKRMFLAFLERRLGNRDVAEDILQAAFAKAADKGGAIRDGERSVAWFYRLLRNALVDHHRREGARARMLESEARQQAAREDSASMRGDVEEDKELERVICACVAQLLQTLKREYREIVRAVDLDGRSVSEIALELGITKNNASVRLLRARHALRRQLQATCRACATHGCLDCTCSPAAAS